MMKEAIGIERLEADAMKSIGGGDMRSVSTGWESTGGENAEMSWLTDTIT